MTLVVGWKAKVKSFSHVWLFAAPWTVATQAPPSMEFSRQGYWSGLQFPSPRDVPDPGIKPRFPALQADSLPSEPHRILIILLWIVWTKDQLFLHFPTNHFMSMVRYLRLSCQYILLYKVFLQIKQEPTNLKSSLMNLNFERNKHTKVPKDKDRRMGNVVAKRNNSQVILMPWVGGKSSSCKEVLRLWQVKIIGPLNVESKIKMVYILYL